MTGQDYDIVIVGGGNAALCAAITASEAGARVLVLEGAPKPYRGGNSRHTRNFRCMHRGPLSVLTGTYDEAEYYDDLMKVTGGKTDEALARLAIRSSEDCLPWMEEHGSASSRRCPARSPCRARTRFSSAAARRWSTPITGRP